MPKPAPPLRRAATADGQELGARRAGRSAARSEQHANREVDWDRFDSDAYYARNYNKPLKVDRRIVRIVARHFAWCLRFTASDGRRGIDVGSGTNLYPALTMLPFAASVGLFERAKSNRGWLAHELGSPHESWHRFWKDMRGVRPRYWLTGDPLGELRQRAQVLEGNVFDLPEREYDIGTMFFVAESITSQKSEFVNATRTFVKSLRPDAPFAAAFMRKSRGYRIGNQKFPACSVTEVDIKRALAPVAKGVKLSTLRSDLPGEYEGMIVAVGRRHPGS